MNTIKFQTVANYIKKNAEQGNFSGDTARKLVDGDIVLRDNVEYVRREVTAGGRVDLIKSGDDESIGVSSFVGNKLEKHINQVITAMRVAFASDVASGKASELAYKNDAASVPAGLQSSHIIIEQDSKILLKLPISAFVRPANEADSAFTDLAAFLLLKEEVPFKIGIEFPDVVTLGADKHYIEVALKGMATYQR